MTRLKMAGLTLAAATALCVSSAAATAAPLKFPTGIVLPPMSTKTAKYFQTHPEAFSAFIARLPHSERPIPQVQPPTSPWVAMTGAPGLLCDAHLMHNGNVLAHLCNDQHWYKLVPNSAGSYVAGTWSPIASMPVIGGTQYAPKYYSTEVLPDGRLLAEGGEYNVDGTSPVWTNLGAIYSQSSNTWTAVNPPAGVTEIGDSQSVLLTNGRMMIGLCCNSLPSANYLFNPSTLTWSSTGAPSDYQNEQGYELLPSGKVLTIDVPDPPQTQLYTASSGTWATGSSTPMVLPDTCGTAEIGPAVVRGNQTLVAFGGDTCGTNPVPTAIRNNTTGMWSAGPNIPAVCGSGGTSYCTLADAPAAQLPDGRILFAASAGYDTYPTHFFEMTVNNVIVPTTDHPDAPDFGSFYFNFLMLPTGQVMVVDQADAYVYNSTLPDQTSWAPVISTAPTDVTRGTTYTITGNQLSGRTAGAYYGDDWQTFTNFPLVKVVNNASGHVTYANTTDVSTYSIAQNVSGSFKFTLPSKAQTGASTLYVVASGSKSIGQAITVH